MFDTIENPSALPGPCTSEARLGLACAEKPDRDRDLLPRQLLTPRQHKDDDDNNTAV